MKNLLRLLVVFLGLLVLSPFACAERRLTVGLAKDIAQTYGFYEGQEYSLDAIAKKYPSLSGQALTAKYEFLSSFKSSVDAMDALMSSQTKEQWESIKRQVAKKLASTTNTRDVTESQARSFIDQVRQRAKGKIDSPMLETLLLFKSGYEENPELEFLDGYKYKFASDGSGNSRGVVFSLEAPKTWIAADGKRPHIVKKFVSENGRGLASLLILIEDVPLAPGETITEKDLVGMLNPAGLKDFLPEGATYLSSGKMTLEGLPGFWMHFKANFSRVRSTIGMETMVYTVFYKNKMIQMQGQVATSLDGNPVGDSRGFKPYEKLFDLMANSVVFPGVYKQ